MIIIKCDRCDSEIKPSADFMQAVTHYEIKLRPKRGDAYAIDLCRACQKALDEWLSYFSGRTYIE